MEKIHSHTFAHIQTPPSLYERPKRYRLSRRGKYFKEVRQGEKDSSLGKREQRCLDLGSRDVPGRQDTGSTGEEQ